MQRLMRKTIGLLVFFRAVLHSYTAAIETSLKK